MKESKQVTEVKRKTSEIPTRDEELHSEDIPFLRGGLQKWSKAERTRHRSFTLAFAKTLTSHSPYSTKRDYILLDLFSSPKWCVLNEGWRHTFIMLPRRLSRGRLHFTQGGRHRNFHAKDGRVARKSQTGRPPLGRPAYDLRHLSTTFE